MDKDKSGANKENKPVLIAEQLARILIMQIQDKRKSLNTNKDKAYDKRTN